MNRISLIALDMDGTLLKDNKDFTDYTRRVLQTLADQGLVIVPATGRGPDGLTDNILTVHPVPYGICSNGALIMDLSHHRVLKSCPLEKEQVLPVLEYLKTLPAYFYIHTNRGTFRQSMLERQWLFQHYPFLNFPSDSFCSDLSLVLMDPDIVPIKIGVFVPDQKILNHLLSHPMPSSDLRAVRTGSENIEINSARISKGAALAWLCEYLNIPLSQTLAIGDSQNDLEMLQAAGVSAAMENGLDEVKKKADYLCRSNQTEGAARFLAEYFGLNNR